LGAKQQAKNAPSWPQVFNISAPIPSVKAGLNLTNLVQNPCFFKANAFSLKFIINGKKA
jgi:hypothetical protein